MRTGWKILLLGIVALFSVGRADAAVAVINNRTAGEIDIAVTTTDTSGQRTRPMTFHITSGDIAIVPLLRGQPASLTAPGVQYAIEADAAYYFATVPPGKTQFGRIGMGDASSAGTSAMPGNLTAGMVNLPQPAARRTPEEEEAARTITVKVLVDEEEPSRRPIWERRLKERIAAASEVIEHTCGMKLKVIGADTWQSDNSNNDFDKAVAEFTQKVDPGDARIAIGFTSQYLNVPRGRTHLGGTRGPLSHHILLREWSQFVSEQERLELLVHELGHFLGAVHSPESDSVMRVILGDKQARVKRFQIHFDPLNALAMNLVAEEWRQRGQPLRGYAELSQPTREKLRPIYEAINQALPVDGAAAQYLRILQYTGAR